VCVCLCVCVCVCVCVIYLVVAACVIYIWLLCCLFLFQFNDSIGYVSLNKHINEIKYVALQCLNTAPHSLHLVVCYAIIIVISQETAIYIYMYTVDVYIDYQSYCVFKHYRIVISNELLHLSLYVSLCYNCCEYCPLNYYVTSYYSCVRLNNAVAFISRYLESTYVLRRSMLGQFTKSL